MEVPARRRFRTRMAAFSVFAGQRPTPRLRVRLVLLGYNEPIRKLNLGSVSL